MSKFVGSVVIILALVVVTTTVLHTKPAARAKVAEKVETLALALAAEAAEVKKEAEEEAAKEAEVREIQQKVVAAATVAAWQGPVLDVVGQAWAAHESRVDGGMDVDASAVAWAEELLIPNME